MSKKLKQWQGLVVKEKAELDKKIKALDNFRKTSIDLGEHSNYLLFRQQMIMSEYSSILMERIRLFK